VLFALDKIEMSWDYFLRSVGLQEKEKQPNTQIDDKGDEDGIEDKVSLKLVSHQRYHNNKQTRKGLPKLEVSH